MSDALSQDGHDFVGAACADGAAPVVGFGVAALVEMVDCFLDVGEGAEKEMADAVGLFGGVVGWGRVGWTVAGWVS